MTSDLYESGYGPAGRLTVRVSAGATSASGMGYLRIASTLNRERVKNPNGQDRSNTTKRSDQVSASGIKVTLSHELYRVKLLYGRTRNVWTPDVRMRTGVMERRAVGADQRVLPAAGGREAVR